MLYSKKYSLLCSLFQQIFSEAFNNTNVPSGPYVFINRRRKETSSDIKFIAERESYKTIQ